MGANHDPFCMPYGKIVEAWVEPREDRHVLVARFYVEDQVQQLMYRQSGKRFALLDFANYPKPFKKWIADESNDQTEVHVDFVNFENKQRYGRFLDEVSKIGDDIKCGTGLGRKSLIPEPFIEIVLSHPEASAVFSLVGLWALARVRKFINHTVDETFRKVGDEISDKLSEKIIATFSAYRRHKSPDERPVVTQIVVPGDVELNLVTRTEPGAEFQGMDLGLLRAEIEKYSDLLQGADSVTFGREGDNNWEFLYLTTKTGEVIGTLECFERTMKTLDEVRPRNDSNEEHEIEE